MLRKLNIAIDCTDDQQKEQVQQALAELGGMNLINGTQILKIYPFFRAHQLEIMELFSMIAKDGPSAVVSFRGAMLVNSLRK
jgi:hypothetical protein